MSLLALVDTSKTSLFLSLVSIAFQPDGVEHRRSERISQTRPYPPFWRQRPPGLLLLAACIFSAGMLRDHLCVLSLSSPPLSVSPIFAPRFSSRRIETQPSPQSLSHRYRSALLEQPLVPLLPAPLDTLLPLALFVAGQTFVVSSTWALGVTGTFLGDYFGILMDHRVEGFPFNVLRDPMYVGSTMCFAATALWYERPVGLLVTLYVHILYTIALSFEGPFTDMIYSTRYTPKKVSEKEL
ncbi:phospholipid methyltransferase [Lactarius pseudohatsudake]|nr:phospholipid methyltransferase [Lactarius pseudohatsudake]